MVNNEIVLRMRSFDSALLDSSVKGVIAHLSRSEVKVSGPVMLPVKKHRYTVNRSPHVNKKSREHFEMRVHRRLIILRDPYHQIVESLQRFDVPAGVDVKIKVTGTV